MNTTKNTIFITGGSAGIGLEIAKRFSAEGNKVIINGRNKERLDNALRQLDNAVALQGDLSIESERIRIAETLKKEHPELNVIVNNAATAFAYSLGEVGNAYSNAAKEINTNYIAIVHFTELLLPVLKANDNAAVINITSIVGLLPSGAAPTYAASKAALHFYTQSLRQSVSQHGINVFEVLPPLVNTDFSADIGGIRGISPREVAEDLFMAFRDNRFDVPVGQTKKVYALFQDAMAKMNN